MSKSVRAFLRRAAIALGLIIAANVLIGLFWSPDWFTYVQVPISCAIFIIFLGITLYDTLFYDRPH